MPMSEVNGAKKGDLKMRASVVYHYASDAFDPPTDTDQQPIACVSSYYDPTNRITAKNIINVDGDWEKIPPMVNLITV